MKHTLFPILTAGFLSALSSQATELNTTGSMGTETTTASGSMGQINEAQSDSDEVIATVGIMNFDPTATVKNNLNGTITPIPEPTAALIGSLGLFALLRRRRH